MGKQKRPANRNEARASAAKRRKRHKKRYFLYYLLALVLVLAAGTLLSLTVFFRIEAVEVEGNSKYANGEIIETTGIQLGDNLFRLRTGDMEEKLLNRYPYMEEVTIERDLPNTVRIKVVQAVPVDVIEASDGYLLLDGRGKILERGLETLPEGYTRVLGIDPGEALAGQMLPEECEEQLSMLHYLDEAVKAEQFEKVDLIDLTDRLNIRMLYDGRLLIELGSELELDYKLRFAKHTIDHSVEENFVGILDVSTRPMARLRQQNIYLPENWPFPIEILPDYAKSLILPSELPEPSSQEGEEGEGGETSSQGDAGSAQPGAGQGTSSSVPAQSSQEAGPSSQAQSAPKEDEKAQDPSSDVE